MILLSDTDLTILRLYQEPHRHYHSVFHILEMLELHDTGRTRGIDIPGYRRPALGVFEADFISAVVAHDCVYQIGRPSGWNEQQSLATWEQKAGREGSHRRGIVGPLILSTITHQPDALHYPEPWRPIVSHLIDLDMSVLGATREEFDRNSANIKAEFLAGGVPEDSYDAGRRGFFAKTLTQPRIFFTDQFHAALEARARQNMIEDLGPSWPIPDEWRTGR